jgi:hypothetical protein
MFCLELCCLDDQEVLASCVFGSFTRDLGTCVGKFLLALLREPKRLASVGEFLVACAHQTK